MSQSTLAKTLIATAVIAGTGTVSAQQHQGQDPMMQRQQQQQQQPQQQAQQDPQAQQALARLHAINQVESELALAGINQAQNEEVREFAGTIAEEHQQNDRQLMEKARELQIELTPSQLAQRTQQQLEQKTQKIRQQLEQAQGMQFDQAFVQAMVQTHRNAITELRGLRQQVRNEQVTQLIDQRLESLQEHLNQAQELQQQMQQQRQQRQQQQ